MASYLVDMDSSDFEQLCQMQRSTFAQLLGQGKESCTDSFACAFLQLLAAAVGRPIFVHCPDKDAHEALVVRRRME